MNTKQEIIELLSGCAREGLPTLTALLLEGTDFFTAPASTKYHGNFEGGLAIHSLNVYDSLCLISNSYLEPENRYNEDTLKIVGLLHDVCKINTYIKDEDPATDAQLSKLRAMNGPELPREQKTKSYVSKVIDALVNNKSIPDFAINWKVKEELPLGHGEKSIYLIQKYIDLTDEEALAIRWHLGTFDHGTAFAYPSGFAIQQATDTVPLVSMLISADYLSTWLVDIKK
jgi:HD superfamily phosphohydrolase YqeK